jgi:transposase
MGAIIQSKILGLEGQVINRVEFNEETGRIRIICDRDRRYRPVDHRTGKKGLVNRYWRRTIRDVPLMGHPCEIEIEYIQASLSPTKARVEVLSFLAPGARVTRRYGRMIAGMARHMPISVVARHTGLSWDTVKAIECTHLAETIAIPKPQALTGIRYLGVDEVARAKGQNYFTLVYDLSPGNNYGRIVYIKEGREAKVFSDFLELLSPACAAGIEAIAMDMGPAYISAAKKSLPHAAIVFDRFHVMQMFSKVIRACRKAEFEEAKKLDDLTGQETIKGSLWLLLSNRTTLKQTDQERLDQLLAQNKPLSSIYALKEQLQQVWQPQSTSVEMTNRLDEWCGLATAANIAGLNKFVKTLQSHRTGICAYGDHPITTSRLEAGNVAIGLLRKRARGYRDNEYFKLKILQTNTPDTPSFLHLPTS